MEPENTPARGKSSSKPSSSMLIFGGVFDKFKMPNESYTAVPKMQVAVIRHHLCGPKHLQNSHLKTISSSPKNWCFGSLSKGAHFEVPNHKFWGVTYAFHRHPPLPPPSSFHYSTHHSECPHNQLCFFRGHKKRFKQKETLSDECSTKVLLSSGTGPSSISPHKITRRCPCL